MTVIAHSPERVTLTVARDGSALCVGDATQKPADLSGWTTVEYVRADTYQGAVDDAAAMRALLTSIRAAAVRDDLDLRGTVAAIDRITTTGGQ